MHFIFLIIYLFSHFVHAENLVLLLGQKKKISNARSVWVENSKIIRIDEQNHLVVMRAVGLGKSLVRINNKKMIVTVLSFDQMRTLETFQETIKNTFGLHLNTNDGSVEITGKLIRFLDWQNLAFTCKKIRCDYEMSANINTELLKEAEQKINESLKRQALPIISLEKSEQLKVELPTKSKFLKPLRQALSVWGIRVETNDTALELSPLVKVQITVAEVKKSLAQTYGIKWPGTYNAQILPNYSGFNENSSVALQMLESTGLGKILASPNILCRSGEKAEFNAGGEFPIKIMNFRLQDVVWKKYGILLKISPKADYSGRILLSLETEVSSIDPSRTVDGVPGLFINRVQSHFDLLRPKTIALSGLIKSEDSKSAEGWPGLTRIPILGALFSSREFKENKTELVIFVRPEIVDANSPEDKINLPPSFTEE